jgi:ribosomal protein L32
MMFLEQCPECKEWAVDGYICLSCPWMFIQEEEE